MTHKLKKYEYLRQDLQVKNKWVCEDTKQDSQVKNHCKSNKQPICDIFFLDKRASCESCTVETSFEKYK